MSKGYCLKRKDLMKSLMINDHIDKYNESLSNEIVLASGNKYSVKVGSYMFCQANN